jgi:hypothetical protein
LTLQLFVGKLPDSFGLASMGSLSRFFTGKRKSRDCCVISAHNTGSSYVIKTFSGEKDKQLFEDGLQRINSLDPSQVFQTLREKLAYEETGNDLPAVHTPTVNAHGVNKIIVPDVHNQSSAP